MKTIKQTGFLLALALITFSCGKSGDTVETTDAKEVASIQDAETLNLDTEASSISWNGYKPAGQHHGVIPATEGQFLVNGSELVGGSFNFDITKLEIHDLEAGSEGHGKLFNHLQSADFFDAANHPTATFEITSVDTFKADDIIEVKEEYITDNTPTSASELAPATPTHWISGNLTMRGNTKNIKFPAAVAIADGKVSAKAGFNIDRTAWGLSYGDEATATDKAKDQFIYNTVSISLDVTGK